ncbi:hypothetical protein [Dactylosporangium sp. NPDC048998]|uniref:hypothetical protein n=1 Tax=Dactylosporangium sp. NPDC048998 TaxID=3363976 RepID=UPI0037159ADF
MSDDAAGHNTPAEEESNLQGPAHEPPAAPEHEPAAPPAAEQAHAAAAPSAAEQAHAAPPPSVGSPSPVGTPPPVGPPPGAPIAGAVPPLAGWRSGLRGRRGPVIAGAALLLGCVLGAGVTAVGAAVVHGFGHDGHGPIHDRGDHGRYGGGRDGWGPNSRGDDGRYGGRNGKIRPPAPPAPAATTPTSAAPAPSAS